MLFVLGESSSQELTVIRNDQQLPVNRIEDRFWHIEMEDEDYYLLERSAVETLAKRIDSLKAVVEHREAVIAAQETLLVAYEVFEKRAGEHINVQREMIATADSLFHGYRSLYNDMKQLIATPGFGLSGGLGLVYLEEDVWRPVGMLGIQYHRWQVQYQIGRRYHGLILGFRLPIFY